MSLNTYLHFNGNCAEAFKYYQELLGGTNLYLLTHKGSPMAETVGPEWQEKIMHARLVIGGTALMGADSPPAHYQWPGGFSVSIEIEEPKEAERVFAGLAQGGSISMPIQETFWAHRFGMCRDQFGIPWMVDCAKPMPQA